MYDHVMVPKAASFGSEILATACQTAMAAASPQAALPALIEVLGEAFGARRAYIYQLLPGAGEYVCTCEWCADGVEPMADVTHGITTEMAMRWFTDGDARSLLAVRDVDTLARVNPAYADLFAARSMRTQVLGKLLRGTHPVGTLGFDDPDDGLFDDLCSIMYPVCAFTTSVLNTAELLERIHTVGLVDRLTGAGTRMGFYQRAEELNGDAPVGIAYLDVVGLQGVNDVRGHEAGDDLLVSIRQILATEFTDGQIFRMSGDKFCAVASGVGETDFSHAVTRLRHRLDELSVYVALGWHWRRRLGPDYDALLRRAYINCTNDKQAWLMKGGRRLADESLEEAGVYGVGASSKDESSDFDVAGCYDTEEFFHRASVWMRHTDERRMALIAFDINYFKLYNDIFGRDAGDLMLEGYAKGISNLARTHHGIAGYLGGDNFALLLPLGPDDTNETVRDLLMADAANYEVAEGFAPAIGVVVCDDLSLSMTAIYDHALVALQEVKGSYTDHIAFYDERRLERERKNQMILMQAQEGLAKGEFTFYLQPKVNISTNKVVSAEALVRWVHDGEVVYPGSFIELMETSGYIFALDRHIWESVCAWQRSLIDRGIKPVPISVNVSRIDFHFTDLAEHFTSLVRRYGIEPGLVGIEVTESAYSRESGRINDVVRRMQQAGFRILMDDFGSGYSSLNMLRDVSVDILKMDKGFIDHARIEDGSDAIISNVIKMAHMMGLPVVSEGVETKEQRDSLRKMECDYVQGYFYYRPMDVSAFEEILTNESIIEPDYLEGLRPMHTS